MGGLVPPAEPVGVALIERALVERKRGNQLAFVKLQHSLARGPASEVTELLCGLSHFAASHFISEAHAHPQCIRDLMKLALEYDFGARPNATQECKPTPALLEAYQHFVLNLVSANSTLVEHALACFAKRAFVLPVEERAPVMECVHSLLPSFLNMHPQANDVLARVILDKHPHPIRKAPDLVSFTRSILEVALNCRSQALRSSILATVIQKLVDVQALVPEDVHLSVEEEPSSDDDEMSDLVDKLLPPKVTFAPLENEGGLCPEAEKVDLILAEVFAYLRKATEAHGDKYSLLVIEPLVHSFERFVVPVGGGRFVPYVLLYSISLAGSRASEKICERFRHYFFDASLSIDLRVKNLLLSSALVSRCQAVSPRYCLEWMRSIAVWLNRYSDPYIEYEADDLVADFNAVVHKLFYSSICCLLKTITVRKDAIDPKLTLNKDVLSRMRLLRVLFSPLNPLFAVPSQTLKNFVDMALAHGGLDVRTMSQSTPNSEYGNARFGRNRFVHEDLLAPLELPQSRKIASSFYRVSDSDHLTRNAIGSPCDSLDKQDNALSVSATTHVITAVATESTPMVLSSS